MMTGQRRCDLHEARRLRAEGRSLKAIADMLEVSHSSVSRACAGIVCPIEHSWTRERQKAFRAEREANRARADVKRERAREMRRAGATLVAISREIGVSYARVHAYVEGVRRGYVPPANLPSPTSVPKWAREAGLSADYRDFAATFGVSYAARECRRLKAEAARPC